MVSDDEDEQWITVNVTEAEIKWLLGTNSPYNHEGKRSYIVRVWQKPWVSLKGFPCCSGEGQVNRCLMCAGEVMQGQSPPPGRG